MTLRCEQAYPWVTWPGLCSIGVWQTLHPSFFSWESSDRAAAAVVCHTFVSPDPDAVASHFHSELLRAVSQPHGGRKGWKLREAGQLTKVIGKVGVDAPLPKNLVLGPAFFSLTI